jgi:BirA family biotin operon repressor/biotin-[acetyl-CoA-carboxylase] ligase
LAEAGPFAVERFASLGSTNDEAMARARSGERGPLFIVAESQTGGRGRQGRVWTSPPGNLYASLLLTDPAPLAVIAQLGFVAGVALAEALRHRLGDDRLRLKWPNDVLFDGAKLAGLLLESATMADGRIACVIGFGVNCASHPDGLAYPATHLGQAAGTPITPEEVLSILGPSLELQLARWDRGAGFAAIRSAWLAIAAGLGDMIHVRCFSRTVTGTFHSLDSTGRLLVETAEGRVAIDAGDVFLHGAIPGT